MLRGQIIMGLNDYLKIPCGSAVGGGGCRGRKVWLASALGKTCVNGEI